MSITYTAYSQKQAPIDTKRLKIYAGIGLAFFLIRIMSEAGDGSGSLFARGLNEAWRAVYVVAANYWFFDFALPSLSRKRVFRSFLLVLGQIFLYSFCLYAWRFIGIQLHIWTPLTQFATFCDGVANQLSYGAASFAFFGIAIHIFDHIQLRQTAQQLRIEKQEAELNYLKSQTNPHFLFNTLNNIYSLARDKSDLAPESILRLSEILRFMLYKTKDEHIGIEQEINIIQDYIALEKLRYDDALKVDFNFQIENPKQRLPPLLLVPLVENAFKHGVSENTGRPFVDIFLSVKSNILFFGVKNSIETSPADDKTVKENIGLSNLRRQLELLYADYELNAAQNNNIFAVNLKINLASRV